MGNLQVQSARAAAAGGMAMASATRSQFHRFVTVSDDCKVDFVSTLAQKTLAPDNDRNIHGKTARKLGGIRGSSVVHLVDPHYLLTPDQYDLYDEQAINTIHGHKEPMAASSRSDAKRRKHEQPLANNGTDSTSPASPAPPQNNDKQPSSTRSTVAAHSTSNYLKGISRESRDHPLSTDLPEEVRRWLGEIMI